MIRKCKILQTKECILIISTMFYFHSQIYEDLTVVKMTNHNYSCDHVKLQGMIKVVAVI